MGLDHSNAFVRITFDGLIGFCICKREDYRCEMGIVQAPDHEPILNIIRIHPNGTREYILTGYPLKTDIRIEANSPIRPGASTFPSSFDAYPFDRISDTGDHEDFRWVMDLQGDDFHGAHLKLRRGGASNTLLRPRITVPHGIFYTLEKTQDQFERIRHPEDPQPRPIGKIADQVGADILCKPDDNGQKLVTVKIVGEEDLRLYKIIGNTKGFRYSITITNLCRRPGTGLPVCPGASDFPHYYKVAEDEDGIKYDVRTIHEPEDPDGQKTLDAYTDDYYSEFRGFRSNGSPQVCALAFFGRTNSIP